ncbi:MAG: hypothetical protein COW30_12660 [Rhodospirillales bacterium CG15_BIG_FIL_POST_REV_8_21_14_020_66_15]|nr:MAG: hypothetical protein COW30_12660 [Rhodospirillales bacterium CG15_BIG_FIL_POST_REV_8_21_14_020_66_15]
MLISACTMTGGPGNIYPAVAPVPAGSELLSFTAPGLKPQSVLRAEYKDNYQEEEYALFRGEGGAQAEVFSAEASSYGYGAQGGDRHVLEFSRTTKDTLNLWNLGKAGKFAYGAESFAHKGKLPYYLLPFERKDTGQSCFGFHAEFNSDPHDYRNGYDNHLFGYYCAPKGTKLNREAMISAVDGVDIAGVTRRAPAAVTERPFQQLKNDAQLVAAVKRGQPAGEAGMDAFPLYLVRIYSDRLGGSDGRP